jgi:transcriptional regulator
MHPNPAFRAEDRARHLEFARKRAFGTLAVNADPAPLVSHIPFLLDETGECAHLHLVRSNPIARLGAVEAVIAVTGPDGYVSPDWYGVDDQVPTWNYVAVHLRGRLEPLPQDTMRDMLDRQSAHFEDRLRPKTPWTTDKMTADVMERMMRQILPFRFEIARIDGTWKLNQNKDVAVRLRAADHIETGHGMELAELARLMRDVPEKE